MTLHANTAVAFMMAGSKILPLGHVEGVSYLDITPTILHFFEIPHNNMDGKALEALIKR